LQSTWIRALLPQRTSEVDAIRRNKRTRFQRACHRRTEWEPRFDARFDATMQNESFGSVVKVALEASNCITFDNKCWGKCFSQGRVRK
jgi:hypothetical protein